MSSVSLIPLSVAGHWPSTTTPAHFRRVLMTAKLKIRRGKTTMTMLH